MGIKHENADAGAEADMLREKIAEFNNKIVKDEVIGDGITAITYVCGEGDPPFIKYALTLEAIGTLTAEQFEALETVKADEAA